MRLKHLLVCCLIWIFIDPNYSQNSGQFIEQSLGIRIPFTVTQFSTKNGLPQSQVLDIVSKENGNLIIATASGIIEYNGNEFKPFINNSAYKNQIYVELFWNEKWKTLYGRGIGGDGFLLYPKYEAVKNFTTFTICKDSIYVIDPKGDIYSAHIVSTSFKKLAGTNIQKSNGLFNTSGNFLISNSTGIYQFNLKTKQVKKISSDRPVSFKKNRFNNTVYAIHPKRILKIEDTGVKTIFDFEELKQDGICHSIEFIGDDDFFVATSRGLFEMTEGFLSQYTKKSALPSVYLQSLYYNATENCLFVGTGEKGLLKLQIKNCFSFSASQGFGETSSLNSIVKAKDGSVLISSADGTIYRMGIDTVYKHTLSKLAYSSLAEIDGNLLVGTWGKGVVFFKDKKNNDSLVNPLNLPNPNVHACYKDARGILWIGTSNGIARGTQVKNVRPYLTGIIKGVIINFYELQNGNLCIGGTQGIYILDKNSKLILHLGKNEGLYGKEVRCFYEDEERKLWIGTYGGGLYCYYKGKLTSINGLKNSKLDVDVFCLAKDDLGYLYMTSNHGLWRVNKKQLSDFYYGKLKYLIPFHYEEESGILNTEFNGGFQNNYLKTKTNHFYFPTLQGVVMVFPDQPIFRKLAPVVNNLFINDSLHDLTKPELGRNTFSTEFKFSSTNFFSGNNLYYQCKLTGEKATGWSALEKDMSVTYKLIPPGSYTFSVRAIDAFNDNNPKIQNYVFEIKPYFYETLWFKTCAFLLLILLVSFFVRLRVQNFREKAEEKEKIKRQMAELELQAIQSQMNPHFIFNSLNSIKYYLSINDQTNADMYIDHFSKLLRDFLESGSKSFINLGKEVQIITSYLELEKQRMNPSFDFFIEAPNQLQLLLIPTHLIQPFVENAIKHGINHSAKKCYLNLRFSKEDDTIICVIEDNGIGREKANEINKNRPYHVSKGVEIVLEKIRIVKEIYNIHIKLTIEDKVDEFSQPIGTYVTLIIPIKKDENTNN